MEESPWIDPLDLAAANARCDAELRYLGMGLHDRLRSSWNEAAMVIRGELTDRKIAQYEKAGFYSLEFKAARKALMDKKAMKRNGNGHERKGNFVERDGRLIYAP